MQQHPTYQIIRRFHFFLPSKWIYLGDLVLRNKDTYIGDVVTMGGERVGGGGAASSALVHRVNPVEGAEWVLIIDWFPVQG